MTFFKKKGVAWLVLIMSIVLALFIGINKEVDTPTSGSVDTTLDSSLFVHYVDDAGKLLSSSTEKAVAKKNAQWDYEYDAHVAVVTTDDDVDVADYADDTFDDMDLEPRDMILVLAENGDWYVLPGYDADRRLTDKHYDNIGWAIQDNADNDKAVDEFLDAVDSFYADRLDRLPSSMESSGDSSFLTKLIILVIILFVVWAIIDGIRYRSYRRRYMRPGMGVPTRRYYPVFWGRRTMMPPRPPKRRPSPPLRSSRPSGGFGGSRPSSRPSGGFGGSRSSRSSGGFGGSRSSRSSFSGSRSGGSRGGFGGSRGGSRGGRGGRR